MIDGKRVLAVIAARGGSKGLPRKNVLDLGGRPMVAWSVVAAHGAATVDRTVLSTDDDEIIAAARAAGCEVPFKRPPELATDTAGIQDAMIHALDSLGEDPDYLVLLQATSPLRHAADIDAAVELCHRSGASSAVSVTEAAKAPFWMFTLDGDGGMHRVVEPPGEAGRRQDLPRCYALNGAVYVVRLPWFRENRKFIADDTRAYVMTADRSVDVDSRLDLLLARAILADRTGECDA
jgi:N-acylneuraminate cytidylyltransferase